MIRTRKKLGHALSTRILSLLATGRTHTHGCLEGVIDPPLEAWKKRVKMCAIEISILLTSQST